MGIDRFLLLWIQRFVNFFSDLEFEVDGNERGGWVIFVRGRPSFFPSGKNDIPKTRLPSVSAVSLSGGKLSLLVLIKLQVRLGGLGSWAAVIVKPRTNSLTREMNDREYENRSS